ncbi:MAG: rhamnogalacturonan acetylesterase [Segetibacter sp.]|nr:rhamnogalacturonan acetylesterase [Segetibacter sp.]
MKRTWLYPLIIVLAGCAAGKVLSGKKPVFYIIGDSTVRNGDGSGKNQQWGWGSFIDRYFDTTKISIQNHAIGGRSSRTFLTEGRWDKIFNNLKEGDYVIMQFGHNDSGPLDDTARARGTLKGITDDFKSIYNPITKKQEVVYTYGWYLRKFVANTRSKGGIPIVCSPIPRNDWKDSKVVRSADSYAKWAKDVAREEGALFIDLNEFVATKYESMGADAVKPFFPVDHTHTNLEGAKLNAEIVVNALKELKPKKLDKYFKQ